MENLASQIPNVDIMIPCSLINPYPEERIAWRKLAVICDFNNPERYFQRMDEIVYEVSEEMAVLP